jgi:hypothetical protein
MQYLDSHGEKLKETLPAGQIRPKLPQDLSVGIQEIDTKVACLQYTSTCAWLDFFEAQNAQTV